MESIVRHKTSAFLKKLDQEAFKEKSDNSSIISFSGKFDNFFVGMVDIVNSTQIAARLTIANACKYYGIFLNSMAAIASHHHATIVKNVGDSLLFYFPIERKEIAKSVTETVLKCGMDMLAERDHINILLQNEGLPRVSYRISYDYGMVMIANEISSKRPDIFGTPVNMCSKINHFAKPNEMVIGGDMYEISRSTNQYTFREVKACSAGFKFPYPIYAVSNVNKMF